MTALVIASVDSGTAWMVGIMVLIAVGVLLPHLGAYRPAKETVKRTIAAVLVAGMVGTIGATVARADEPEFVILNPCAGLTPADLGWWLHGCIFLPRRSRRRLARRTR